MRELPYCANDGHRLRAYATWPEEERESGKDTVLLLHAGGPDHQSLVPLAARLQEHWNVILPDIRGYGRSVCREPACHTWAQYVEDVVALLDHVHVDRAFVAGVGLGATIALRLIRAYPDRVAAAALISVEDIEDDEAKACEIDLFKDFRRRLHSDGLDAAWDSVLGLFPPIVGSMVRDAIPRSDCESIAAAVAIGFDRSFRSVDELAAITTPALVIPGIDARHPLELAQRVADIMPNAELASVAICNDLRTADDFARAFADEVTTFFRRPAPGQVASLVRAPSGAPVTRNADFGSNPREQEEETKWPS